MTASDGMRQQSVALVQSNLHCGIKYAHICRYIQVTPFLLVTFRAHRSKKCMLLSSH